MLGESIVIVPKRIEEKKYSELSELIYELNNIGFRTQKTKIRKLF